MEVSGTGFDWSPYRVLVVEDDEAVRQSLRELLAEVPVAGFRVASDGEEALKVLGEFPADIVLTEGNLKGMDTLDLLRAIRNKETSPRPDVLIAVMALMAETQRLRRMCGIGIESFIKKPISYNVVLKRLANTLANPQPFVSSLEYFGPDRRLPRGASRAPGSERRLVAAPQPKRKPAAVVVPEAAEKPTVSPLASAAPEEKARQAAPGPVTESPPPSPEPRSDPKPPAAGLMAAQETEPETEDRDEAWAEELVPPPVEEEPADALAPGLATKIDEHLEWLRTGGRQGAKASLEGEDLSGAQLRGVNLSDSILRNIDLSDANLEGAVLQGSDLRGANFSGADIREGDLTSSNMRRVDLSHSRLSGARFAGTDLAGASLRGAELDATDFQGVNLLDADLDATDLSKAKGLKQNQVNKARLGVQTLLPPGLIRPEI